ncbi:MAG: carboxylating nicotinate-nucleotide diphosphorylase [Ignavibacteriae bacterium]|nr:carboxylating nicotinate-nucleotide diphosphorylase [Ignavibacteriota bacterium]
MEQNGITACVRHALEEDIGTGDVTTNQIVDAEATIRGVIVAKQEGVVTGLDIAQLAFQLVDEKVAFKTLVDEGTGVVSRQYLAEIEGPARAILSAERTALNFLSRMSGIATLTDRFVHAVRGTQAVILDTRKTAPGLRIIDKLAVRRGGGTNHRMGLFDMILIKDNHIDTVGLLGQAVQRARAANEQSEIEVEARTLGEVEQALELGVKRILLDNMTIEMLREAVRLSAGRAELEASGNITLENVREIAATGVKYISVGALTHSAPAFDVSLKYVKDSYTRRDM